MGLWLNWRRWISLVTLELSLETDKILPCPPFEERVSSRTRNTYMLLSRSILYLWLEIFRKLVWKRVYRQLDRQMVNRLLLLLSHFSRVWLCVTPQMAAHQAPPSIGFSRQEYWSGVPLPSPGKQTKHVLSCWFPFTFWASFQCLWNLPHSADRHQTLLSHHPLQIEMSFQDWDPVATN